jgi:zinc transport system substrate-binding protein
MKNVYRILIAALIIVTGIWLVSSLSTQTTEPETETLSVVTTFYPLAFFTESIGEDLVTVTNLVPPGAEPHDYRPTPQDIAKIYDADLFVYNGGGIDAWASQTEEELRETTVTTIEMSMHIDGLMEVPEGHSHGHNDEDEHEGEDHDEEEHEDEDAHDETFDEHFWLDPSLAIMEVETIRNVLSAIAPEHTETFFSNANDLIDELEQLDLAYQEGLATCDIPIAVTSHAAFGYLAHAYNFEMVAIAGISPHEEPSAGDLAEIAETAREYGVGHIFFETLVNPDLAETLAREIGAETLVFNPLGGLTQEELDNEETYLTVMYNNLENLKTGMLCQ